MKSIGIDVAKNKHRMQVLDEDKKKLTSIFFENSHFGLGEFRERIKKYGKDVAIGMESSGIYHHGILHRLKEEYPVMLINPKRIKAHRKSLGYESKTDKIDAYIIADYVKERFKGTNILPEKYPRLKQLCRTRTKLKREQTRYKNRIKGDMHILFPEYEKCWDNIFCKSSIAFLREHLYPAEIKDMTIQQVHTALKKGWSRISLSHAKRIHLAARNSFGIEKPGLDVEMRLAIPTLEHITAQLQQIERLIEHEFEHIPNPFGRVKGLSNIMIAGIIAESGDFSYFRSRDQYYNFTGLPPRTAQSGNFQSSNNRMTKCGSSYLRYYLMQAARALALNNPYFKKLFVKKNVVEKRRELTAYSCVAKKLAHITFKLLKTNQQFCPEKLVH